MITIGIRMIDRMHPNPRQRIAFKMPSRHEDSIKSPVTAGWYHRSGGGPVRAYALTEHGGPEVLRLRDVPDPIPGTGEILVAVRATACNRADAMQRAGHYPPPHPAPAYEIPGLEFAGTVEATGPGVLAHQRGDRVFGLLPGGGYAEKVVTHERMALAMPPRMSWEEAAAIPEVFFTAQDALFGQAGLAAGESVLIHAAGSGVGTAAVQLASAAGATVVGTSRSQDKCARVGALGAQAVVHVPPDLDFAPAVLEANDGRPVDVVLDLVGAAYFPATLAVLAPGGRLVCIGLVGGSRTPIDLGLLLQRRLRIMGSALRSRPLEEKIALTQTFGALVLPRLASGRLRPVIDRVLYWEQAAEAHRLLESNTVFGKIVLRVG